MVKKIVAGIVIAGILSTGSMLLFAKTPPDTRAERLIRDDISSQETVSAALGLPAERQRPAGKADFNDVERKTRDPEIRPQLSPTTEGMPADRLEDLRKKAEELGIDISGLSFEEIRARIAEALKERNEQKIENALERLREKAEALGIDISGLSLEEIRERIIEARKGNNRPIEILPVYRLPLERSPR